MTSEHREGVGVEVGAVTSDLKGVRDCAKWKGQKFAGSTGWGLAGWEYWGLPTPLLNKRWMELPPY